MQIAGKFRTKQKEIVQAIFPEEIFLEMPNAINALDTAYERDFKIVEDLLKH